jgi:hypothetical protein
MRRAPRSASTRRCASLGGGALSDGRWVSGHAAESVSDGTRDAGERAVARRGARRRSDDGRARAHCSRRAAGLHRRHRGRARQGCRGRDGWRGAREQARARRRRRRALRSAACPVGHSGAAASWCRSAGDDVDEAREARARDRAIAQRRRSRRLPKRRRRYLAGRAPRAQTSRRHRHRRPRLRAARAGRARAAAARRRRCRFRLPHLSIDLAARKATKSWWRRSRARTRARTVTVCECSSGAPAARDRRCFSRGVRGLARRSACQIARRCGWSPFVLAR